MNIFRFIADMLHLTAILLLLYRIKNTRNCVGKSKHNKCVHNHCCNIMKHFLTPMCRYIMQNLRNIPNRVLCSLPGSLHVFCQSIQHLHENFLHFSHCSHNILDARTQTLLHNVWLTRRRISTSESFTSGSISVSFHRSRRRHILGICLVILALAWITRFCASNRYAKQN